VSNAPSKPISFSRPKVGYFSNRPHIHRIRINSSETHSEVVAGKLASRNNRMCWGRLISHIQDNPVETEVHLIARISSLCVNVQKFAWYICARTQQTLCVTSSITLKSQAGSSTVLVNYLFDNISAEIYNNKCTLEIYEK